MNRSTGTRRGPTVAVRAALESDRHYGAVVPPLHLSSNFTFAALGEQRDYDYTRSGNPTRDALGAAIAELEGGAGAVVTASGMAAVTLAVHLLETGDLLLAPCDCYGGTYRLLSCLGRRGHFRVLFVDQTDRAALDRAFTLGPRMVWVETPSNPLLRIVDLADIGQRCQRASSLLLVDNTFLSPVLQQPIAYGADLVLHSTTKYLNGHSDVVGGALVARSDDLVETLSFWANCLGLAGAPFDSYLTLRGLRTLHARWQVHERNARAVAAALDRHPAVSEVLYPGLTHHPGHTIAQSQQRGFGAIISFRLRGDLDAVARFTRSLSCFSLAESLGGVESLVAHPATMTHASMPPEARRRACIDDQLLRLSVGIEDGDDLICDLEKALEQAMASRTAAGDSAARGPLHRHQRLRAAEATRPSCRRSRNRR